MAQATKTNGKWHIIVPGEAVHHDDTVASAETVMGWTQEERDAFGVYTVGDADPVPPGKRIVSSSVGDKDGKPVWVNVLADIPPPAPATVDDVDAERDRRLNAGMLFSGVRFQTDDKARERIDRSRMSALAAVVAGAQGGDLQWHGLPVDFFWIAADDSRMPMDAQTMVAFGNAVAAREGMLIVAGNDLKLRIGAGQKIFNVGDDALWPPA